MIGQFYDAVRERFDVDYWPGGLYERADAFLEIRDSGEPAFAGEDDSIESIGILDPGRG